MSGHSKWSTIKHKKAAQDQARGKLFSKLVKGIAIAVKSGGGPDPDSNPKLRMAIDQAKAANMPKENIDRAVSRATGEGESIEEIMYEGFAPGGIGILVQAATDNKNRTVQEIKNIFERSGGSLGGPGSVSFNFEPKGYLLVEKSTDTDDQILKIIDAGADDVEESQEGIEIYSSAPNLYNLKSNLEELGMKVLESELIQKPKSLVDIEDATKTKRLLTLLETIDDHDDVQKVFANAKFPDEN